MYRGRKERDSMPKLRKIEAVHPPLMEKKKVAAYARVSMQSERMLHSLSAQVSHYSSLIQANPAWQYVGVYADDFVSGTNTAGRDEFRRMLADCDAGKIDIILTKTISRFARNTVDLLETVRHLKEIGVEVRFEKERINSADGDGELMLSILASFAQEESRSISENVKWGTRKRFGRGLPNGRFQIYGYRWSGDHLVIEPGEAEIVRLIYANFLCGLSAETTEKQLAAMGVKSYKGLHFSNSSVRHILSNITYTGNLLFQKEYISDPITGKSKINRGELPQYFVENTHEAIIPMEMYQAVQEERKRRRELGVFANRGIHTTCFTSKIKCAICGKSYRRRQRKGVDGLCYFWICRTKSDKGASFCSAKAVPEKTLKSICAEVLGLDAFDENMFSEKIERITIIGEDTLRFHFYDGTVLEKTWQSTARRDWWTEVRRKAWSERCRHKKTNPNSRSFYEFTGVIKCGQCGENYHSQSIKRKDGSRIRIWHCCKNCGNTVLQEDAIKTMVCDVLGLDAFSEEKMDLEIEKITVDESTISFHLKNESIQQCIYAKPKKKGMKHTEEHKRYMSEVMKSKWEERKRYGTAKGKDDSGNRQPPNGSVE